MLEPFVDADTVASFLGVTRLRVQRLTKQGRLTGHPLSGIQRITYKYRLSEVAQDVSKLSSLPIHDKIGTGSPRSSAED